MNLLLGGGKTSQFPLASSVEKLLKANPPPKAIKIGCPFVSEAGLELFADPLSALPAWVEAEKHWIVGVHHGVTEPAALRALRAIPKSSVRVFAGGTRLTPKALRAHPIFHAKVVAIEEGEGGSRHLQSFVVSSANLTRAALCGPNFLANFEAGAASAVVRGADRTAWKRWWEEAWRECLPLDDDLIGIYEGLREAFIGENPVVVDSMDPPSRRRVTTAQRLWIEAGAMSGGSRNQVEFNRELASFFGTVSNRSRRLKMRVQKNQWIPRPLSPKITTFGVEIWRLSLPTEAQGGLTYPGRVIGIERDGDGYAVDVADLGSLKARRWRRQAQSFGHVGVTSGRRAFGLT